MPILNCSECKKGFTLLELLVVMSLTIVLTGGLLIYSRGSERQLTLLRDEARVIGILQQARSGALGTFTKDTCGYGVKFTSDKNRAILFKITPPADSDCSSINYFIYSFRHRLDKCESESGCINEITLDKSIEFTGGVPSEIVFIPPEPTVIINQTPSKTELSIEIGIINTADRKTIVINNSGQISEKLLE